MSPRAPIASQLPCLLVVALTLVLGASVITSPAAEPSAHDLKHGQKQLQRMLDDRPGMALYRAEGSPVTHYLDETDAPWQWAQQAFAGSYVNERVFWDHRPPSGDHLSDSTNPSYHGLYSVSLRPFSSMNIRQFEDAWSRLVFEMLSISRAPEIDRLYDLVYGRQLSIDAAVREFARLHWSIKKQVEQFYHQTWRTWARSRGMPSHPHLWSHDHLGTFESWYEETASTYNYMRKYYERILRPTGR